MSQIQTLRAFVTQRLTAAAEEILELFERTIAEYEEELRRRHEPRGPVSARGARSHGADVQQLMVSKEEVPPEQQDWSPSLDQEDPAELPHIKEEQNDIWTSPEGEQLQGLEEADITEFTFTPDPVTSEDDEEKPQSSQLHRSEEDREAETLKAKSDDCGGPEPARTRFQPVPRGKTSHSSEPEVDDGSDWEEETRGPRVGLNLLQNNVAVSNEEGNAGRSSSASFGPQGHLESASGDQAGVKPFSCSVCGKGFTRKDSLKEHMRLHSDEKSFSCSVCKRNFRWKTNLNDHMRIHTGEKRFSCSVCGKRFTRSSTLTSHLRVHTGEKPFPCSVCNASFSHKHYLSTHMNVHTGEKPFSCSVCGKTFGDKSTLRRHLNGHAEKQFSCSVCGE